MWKELNNLFLFSQKLLLVFCIFFCILNSFVVSKEKEQEDKFITINKQDMLYEILTTKCKYDTARICKTRIKQGKIQIKSIDDCIKKMIKKEYTLTLQCKASLSNIINNTSNSEYKFYNVNGVRIPDANNKKFRLKNNKIKIKQKSNKNRDHYKDDDDDPYSDRH